MEVNHLNLEQILTFGYCPMQYRLRYVLGLPWFPASAEVAYARILRQAVQHYFKMMMSRDTFLRAQKEAIDIIYKGVDMAIDSFPRSAGRLQNFRLEGVLAIHDLKSHFNPRVDSAIGYGVPWSVTSSRPGRQFVVDGVIDALYWKNDDSSDATVVVVTVVNAQDPWEDVAWGAARFGFAQKMARDYVVCDKRWQYPIKHLAFEGRKGGRALDTSGDHYQSLVQAAVQTAEVADKYSMPTAHRSRCEHCPYKTVCSVSLTVDSAIERKDELTSEVLKLAEGNRFYKEGP